MRAVVLAAGYGTRLEADLKKEIANSKTGQAPTAETFDYLSGIPKPLLPLGGKLLLNYWIDNFAENKISDIVIITNAQFYPLFVNWAKLNNFPESQIINDGSKSNAERLGAIADLQLALKSFASKPSADVVVVAGDTLFLETDQEAKLSNILAHFHQHQKDLVLAYELPPDDDVQKRGILEVDEHNIVKKFVEKPKPDQVQSRLACPPFYIFKHDHLHLISEFLEVHREAPLEQRDAPGNLLKWVCTKVPVLARKINGRFDIGNLQQYKEAQVYFSACRLSMPLVSTIRQQQIVSRSYARIGLMGNPSDGFHGKTISFTISNFFAEVVLWESDKLLFLGHPKHDGTVFNGLADLHDWIRAETYNGGIRLMKATCKKFFEFVTEKKLLDPDQLKRNFTLKYDTTVPRQVGLGGSSAIVSACWKALMRFYGLSEKDIPKPLLSWLVLCVEQEELGITAGLQDRVIQIYEGLVHMDFSGKELSTYRYTAMDVALLPHNFFMAWNPQPKDSGKVHNNARQRWQNGDPEIVDGMKVLASYADEAKAALETRNYDRLGQLMDMNFAMRRKMYGDAVVGAANLQMIEIAKQHHAHAKFPGSGGCIFGLPTKQTDTQQLKAAYAKAGFSFTEVAVHSPVADSLLS